ncbi:MAG: OFA family MFS transporter [Deferrisomatales bacterium]|nr:OFA family MFS transporter [Deferrisomatales bacterium]
MTRSSLCDFYGSQEGGCDVGAEYISTSDVQIIVRYCTARYQDCSRFQQLAEGHAPAPGRRREAGPAGGNPAEVLARNAANAVPPRSPVHETTGGIPMSQTTRNRGWTVALSGTGINLALGVLYAWSIFKGAIAASIQEGGGFRWNPAALNDPYAVCCLVFAFAMIAAGRVQDRFGPRLTAMVGGLLVGAGFVWVSQTTSYLAWVLGFGVLAGIGIGFGYSAATPPALKWFPPARTGLIAGIVVSGFGLASVYIAPLATYLLGAYGVQTSMLIFGVAFTVIVGGLSLLLVNPPAGHLFGEVAKKHEMTARSAPSVKVRGDFRPSDMVKTINFYILWSCFFIGSGAGLMVIGSVAGMAQASLGTLAFVAVAAMAVGNAGGRIVAGVVSDRIGRSRTLFIMMVAQAVLMFAAVPAMRTGSAVLLVSLATLIGFNYGTNLSLFPSFTKDFWGLKNFGTNYGILFTSWGVAGFVMGRVSQMLTAATGSYETSFVLAGVLLLAGAGLALTLREGKAYQMAHALEEASAAARPEADKPEVAAAQGI